MRLEPLLQDASTNSAVPETPYLNSCEEVPFRDKFVLFYLFSSQLQGTFFKASSKLENFCSSSLHAVKSFLSNQNKEIWHKWGEHYL